LKRKSIKTYFLERCSGGTKTTDFWNTVKPFFSKKCKSGDQQICCLNFSQVWLLRFFVYWEYSMCFLYMAFLNSPFIHGSGFRLGYRDFNGACLFNTFLIL
jgi:hypothetical protein